MPRIRRVLRALRDLSMQFSLTLRYRAAMHQWPGFQALAAKLGRGGRLWVHRLRTSVALVLDQARPAHPGRVLVFAGAFLTLAVLAPTAGFMHHIYFDRSALPDLEPFIRFEPPAIGAVYDARGEVLIELAREYRRVISYDEIPPVLRQAILSAEDKNFFSHSGVEYGSLPRVIQKNTAHALAAFWKDGVGFRLRFPQGGSTITQQLVRGYLLRDLMLRENGDHLVTPGLAPRLVSAVLGIPATNKLIRKMEEVRLALWLEKEMTHRYGSRELAKREILARYASFIYLGNGRYGYAAGSEYYFGRPLWSLTSDDAGTAALLAGIGKSPRAYAPRLDDPRPVRRRNEILALMARNGYISPCLAKQCQAEPIHVAIGGPPRLHAPGAIENVFAEIRRNGGGRFVIDDLFRGRISVHTTLDRRVQMIVNEALENGLATYEQRHPEAKGLIQGSVVVLRNADAAILAEAGGRQTYGLRSARYSDFNRVTDSLRQPGSAWKPMVYLAAFRMGLDLDATVPDEPIEVPLGSSRGTKWIANYDHQFKGPIPVRQALAESRNAAAVWIANAVGINEVIRTARELGIRSPLHPYISTALGASEVRLLELAGAYRAIASEVMAEPHVIERVTGSGCRLLYEAPRPALDDMAPGLDPEELRPIQEGLRGVVRLPDGTAHALDDPRLPPVMGKTGTTSDFRDALFVGATYGLTGITVAVRVGFDDNRELGNKETGGRTALPIFREIMLRIYRDRGLGFQPAPRFPREIEEGIDEYLAVQARFGGTTSASTFLPVKNTGARRARRGAERPVARAALPHCR